MATLRRKYTAKGYQSYQCSANTDDMYNEINTDLTANYLLIDMQQYCWELDVYIYPSEGMDVRECFHGFVYAYCKEKYKMRTNNI